MFKQIQLIWHSFSTVMIKPKTPPIVFRGRSSRRASLLNLILGRVSISPVKKKQKTKIKRRWKERKDHQQIWYTIRKPLALCFCICCYAENLSKNSKPLQKNADSSLVIAFTPRHSFTAWLSSSVSPFWLISSLTPNPLATNSQTAYWPCAVFSDNVAILTPWDPPLSGSLS